MRYHLRPTKCAYTVWQYQVLVKLWKNRNSFMLLETKFKNKITRAWFSRAETCIPHNSAITVQHICNGNIIYNSKILETTQVLINRSKNNINIHSIVRYRLIRAAHISTNDSHKHVKEDKSWGKIVWCFLYKIKDKYIHTYTRKKLINIKLRVMAKGDYWGWQWEWVHRWFKTSLVLYFSSWQWG